MVSFYNFIVTIIVVFIFLIFLIVASLTFFYDSLMPKIAPLELFILECLCSL